MGGGKGDLSRRVLCWNLYHGRDYPPDLHGDRAWKWWGRPVAGEDHVLVNRNLFREYAAFLAAADWDIALLQEVPPTWSPRLAAATGSEAVRSLTSRNWMRPLTGLAAARRPHLIGSWEGGSNVILVRQAKSRRRRRQGVDPAEVPPPSRIVAKRSATLAWRPERRTVTLVELGDGLCVANLHASLGPRAADDVLRAAELATEWADGRPLILGGDFNARPRAGDLFRRLEEGFGLTGQTADGAIDHLLTAGLTVAEPAAAWPARRRDVPDEASGLEIRLSDHAPVLNRVAVSGS